jgi:hypothetical protein
MANKIEGIKDVDLALKKAGNRNLPILLFFHNPG